MYERYLLLVDEKYSAEFYALIKKVRTDMLEDAFAGELERADAISRIEEIIRTIDE